MALENWSFDSVHSSVGFWVRHMMVTKVHGQFTKWKGTLAFDEQHPATSHLDVEIDASSIDTRDPQRDAHLRSPDFFDSDKYPSLHFVSRRVEGQGTELSLVGDLTLRGVTKEITLQVEYGGRSKHPTMGERLGFSARGTLNRKDFGIVFNQVLDTGGFALADKVELQLEVQATKVA